MQIGHVWTKGLLRSSRHLSLALGCMVTFAFSPVSHAQKAEAAATQAGDTQDLRGTWKPLAWVTQEARDQGVRIGGEGAQWPQSIACDAVDGTFLIFATDVGGLWRSTDSGVTWEPCNVGHTPRGSSGVSMDPFYPERVLSVGSNSMASEWNGLYLSEDRAASWRAVQLESISGRADRRRQLAFDRSSVDHGARMTRRVYWSRTQERGKNITGPLDVNPGLYRSDDGGRTSARLGPASDIAGHSALVVHPTSGRLYAGNASGLWISDNGGEAFEQVFDRPVTGVSVSVSQAETVWVSRPDGVSRSLDAGRTWEDLPTTGLTEPLNDSQGAVLSRVRTEVEFASISVSPSDPMRMAMRSTADDWQWHRHVSHDGGQTWQTARVDPALTFFPQNVRQAMFAWHPTDADRLWSYGGDWVTGSTDGGKTYRWVGEGQNAVYVGGLFSPNVHHPGLLFLSSQDYNGAVTFDHGHTWEYNDVSGLEWGGFNYAGLALSPKVFVAGNSQGWHSARSLRVSDDAGQTWAEAGAAGGEAGTQPASARYAWTGDKKRDDFGYDVGLVHPENADVAFVARFRTADRGQTWQAMEGCAGVFTSDAQGRCYGVRVSGPTSTVVMSEDLGVTWTAVLDVNGGVDDLSVTPAGDRLYVVSRGRLWFIDPQANFKTFVGEPMSLVETPKNRHGVAPDRDRER